MIKLIATAPIYLISPMVEVASKTGGQPFQKRELLLDDSWTDNEGKPHTNIVSIEFTGDKMALLDQFFPGQKVTVEAYVNGRESGGRYFNTIRGAKIAPYQPQQQAQPQQPQQPYQQPPTAQPYYGQQPQQPMNAQPFYGPAQSYPVNPQSATPNLDSLGVQGYQPQPQYPGYPTR